MAKRETADDIRLQIHDINVLIVNLKSKIGNRTDPELIKLLNKRKELITKFGRKVIAAQILLEKKVGRRL